MGRNVGLELTNASGVFYTNRLSALCFEGTFIKNSHCLPSL